MLKSHIEFCKNKPFVAINGGLYYPLAYTTYFEECAEYADFIKSGYRMFFVNVSFSDLPINNTTGFSPFLTGVFEDDKPDYSEFDGRIKELLSLCPDVLIFPRINIAMPRKWISENREECVNTPTGFRESLYSDKYLSDGGKLLLSLVEHIRKSDYADRIAGYQLCGGNTQEWFHHDLKGSFSRTSFDKFCMWMNERYNISNVPKIFKDDLKNDVFNETIARFGEFSCEMAAKTAEHFSKILKEYIDGEQIVGVFYGYNAYLNEVLWGHHGLRHIVASPFIDFFSSPCGYDESRSLGVDWSDMLPTASLKANNKLYFVECDIRTHLTKRMQSSRPGKYPESIYLQEDTNGKKTVWSGPETKELSLSALRKAFIHQLCKGAGIWWFDMWGGWYHDADIMSELCKMRETVSASFHKDSNAFPKAETVVFIDEKAYFGARTHSVNIIRGNLGKTGIPFDFCMVEDCESVIEDYKAAVFTAPVSSASGIKAKKLCKTANVHYIETNPEKPYYSKDELMKFLISCGVHCYNDNGNVIYCGNGYLGVHAVSDGDIEIRLPAKYIVKSLLGTEFSSEETDIFHIFMKQYDTAVFELS